MDDAFLCLGVLVFSLDFISDDGYGHRMRTTHNVCIFSMSSFTLQGASRCWLKMTEIQSVHLTAFSRVKILAS